MENDYATAAKADKFPAFKDGDVHIILTNKMQYQLHHNTLTHSSAMLLELLDEQYISLRAVRNGNTIKQMLVIVENPGGVASNGTVIDHVLEPVQLDGNGRAIGGRPVAAGFDIGDDEPVPPTFDAFDAVFRALYNEPITLGNAQEDSLVYLLADALSIVTVAEYLECLPIITQPIEATFLATGQKLQKAISNNPISWLAFGNRIKSKAIYKEALIHAVGQYNMPVVQEPVKNGKLPQNVLDVLMAKVETLKNEVKVVERQLASYYPQKLMRTAGTGPDAREQIGRQSYSNDVILWIALSWFRHWLSNIMVEDKTHHATDMGWQFLMIVYKAGEAYLNKKQLNEGFHIRFPMSAKGSICIEHRLTEIKENVKPFAQRLLKNASQLDLEKTKINYFVFTDVTEADYPWISASNNAALPQHDTPDDEEELESGDGIDDPVDLTEDYDEDDVPDKDAEQAARLQDFMMDSTAVQNLLGDGDRLESPESHFSGDTEVMSETLARAVETGMETDSEAERLEMIRHGKRKAVDEGEGHVSKQ